jgi:hypothetical protein
LRSFVEKFRECVHVSRRRHGDSETLAEFDDRAHDTIDFERAPSFDVLQRRGLMRADASCAVDPFVDRHFKTTPSRVAMASDSAIISRSKGSTSESVAMSTSVARVKALIGLRHVTEQLRPNVAPQVLLHWRLGPPATNACDMASIAGVTSPLGWPNEYRVPSTCLMTPGSTISVDE